MGKGLFIVFEGGDGVGKSSQVRTLARTLALNNVDHIVTREPGETNVGEKIRAMLLDPHTSMDDRAEALLYAADKAQHVTHVVLPAMKAGKVVVCDRYVDSMIAYQGAGRGMPVAALEEIARWATRDLRPDLTVLLDINPQVALSDKKNKDRLEQAGDDFHARVRQGFLDLAARDTEHYLVLPALTDMAELAAAVRERVSVMLGRALETPPIQRPSRQVNHERF